MNITKKLTPYIALADMLVESFGNTCEVVIHDLSTPENSVVYVSNGGVTNRKIGQSFDHLIKQVLLSKNFSNDYNANYIFTAKNGKKIKSSTSLIRDEQDNVIGAFCINIDIDLLLSVKSFINVFIKDTTLIETTSNNNVETEHIIEIIDRIIDNTIGSRDVSKFKKSDNIEIITFMKEKGIFLTKGSVEKVAKKLNISPVTVYSYLDKIKKSQQ